MSSLVEADELTVKVGSYRTGSASALKDQSMLQAARVRRRQFGQMMTAFDRETAARRLPAADYWISRKIDGEFTLLFYKDGDVITLTPGGTVRVGAPVHEEAARLLDAAGVKTAMFGSELYVQRPDGERPRVHDVTRVARAPADEAEVASLALGVFNIYDLDGVDLSMRYGEALARIEEIFSESTLCHPVETVVGDNKVVLEQFTTWVLGESAEGVVARSDSAGVFKIKLRHTIDLAVIGFSEGIDDRSGMLHSLLVGIVRPDGTFQVVSRVGGGFSDDDRVLLLKQLSKNVVESEYAEVNSDRVAYQMIEPGVVVEISCLDIISRTSRGSTIDRMVLAWDEGKRRWEGVRRLPLASIISPQFLRLRDDKTASADDVQLSQLADITEIPELERVAEDLALPPSKMMRRAVATKELRGATMVRKLVMWETNKHETSRDFSKYVLHLTDYSPNRKNPLDHDIRISDSLEQMEEFWEAWQAKFFVGGWNVVDE